MNATWIGCSPASFQKGRAAGFHPEAIVLHRLNCTLDEARGKFQKPDLSVSAHYAVGKRGEIHQYVDEADTAFHAGVVVNASWRLLKPRVNPNFYTIGIEHEGVAGEDCEEEQLEASAALIAEVAGRWNIPLDEAHIIPHSVIRASRECPGSGLDTGELIRRARLAAVSTRTAAINAAPGEVRILSRANIREAPATSARVVRVAAPGDKLAVLGYLEQGEKISGNSTWYQTDDGNFVWAGASDRPQPAPEAAQAEPPPLKPVPAGTPGMGCGIRRIDLLWSGQDADALQAGDPDTAAVGAIQDLLACQGFSKLPSVLAPHYGKFGDSTRAALCTFQTRCGLEGDGVVNHATLRALVTTAACDPRCTQSYLGLVLGIESKGMQKILSLTAQMEGVGRFASLNRNTDRAGLSFGLIQWAQRPGRLKDIVAAFSQKQRDEYVRIFGGGDARVADGLIALLGKPSGGVDAKTGCALDPAFDLIVEPWVSRFTEAGRQPEFQRIQVEVATTAFRRSYQKLRSYAPMLVSNRAVAFMLDIANQYGDGGAERLFRAAYRPGLPEQALLEAIAAASIAPIEERLRVGVRARRAMFLETALLNDEPFQDSQAATA